MALAAGSRDKRLKDGISSSNGSTVAHQHNTHNTGASMLLWMLVDGIGLAIIAACTILEGFELWTDYFNEYAEFNYSSLTFWFSGRFCQVVGLMSLIIFAASLQVFHELEWAGMMMLTAGPLLNMCACSIFDSGGDTSYLFNKQWMTSECLELLGIFVLDLSLIEGPEHLVLSAEVIGFAILMCAAMIDFDYTVGQYVPSATIRVDLIHISDCFGLGLLTIVAIAQYHIKLAKHKAGQDNLLVGQHQTAIGAQKSHVKNGAVQSRRHNHGSNEHDNYDNHDKNDQYDNNYDRNDRDIVTDEEQGLDNSESRDSENTSLLPESGRENGRENGRSHSSQSLVNSIHRNNSNLSYQIATGGALGTKTSGKVNTSSEKRQNNNAISALNDHEEHND